MNVEKSKTTAEKCNIRGIPTVKMFVEGAVVNEFTGAWPSVACSSVVGESVVASKKSNWLILCSRKKKNVNRSNHGYEI